MEAHRPAMRRLSPAVTLLWVLALLPTALASKRPHIRQFARDWFMGGTAIPTHKSLVLSPGVPSRGGFIWKQEPLKSTDFEVDMTFIAKKPEKRAFESEAFAFWYVHEDDFGTYTNVTATHAHNQDELIAGIWNHEFIFKEFDLVGYRRKFKGLGIFFFEGSQNSVSVIHNDGTKEIKLSTDIPTADALKFDFTTGAPIKLKLRVKPTESTLEIEDHGTIKIQAALQPGGHIGLTHFDGSLEARQVVPGAKTCTVEFTELHIGNHDPKVDESEAEVDAVPEAEVRDVSEASEDILHEASSFKDHRAESDAIKDLTNMVFKLVVETQPLRSQMAHAIDALGKRIAAMEKNFAELKTEIDKKSGHKLGEEFDAIKKELTTLSSVATKETQERHKKLESLHSDIADVHRSAHSPDMIDRHLDKLTQSNSKVLDKLTSEHQMMFGVSIAAIAFIVIAGLSLYNKFRCWEKKHIL